MKCAIFDFDGTLFDSMFIWENVGEIYLHALGLEPKPSLREDVRALSLYQSACFFQREYSLSLSVEKIMAGINRTVEEFYIHEVQPKPGVVPFLERLKAIGTRMCIATASDRYQVEAALKRCQLDGYFDAIFTCTEIGHGKDEPIIYRKAMEHFGADRADTVVFEDAFHAVQTAKNDGFTVAAIFDQSETQQAQLRELADCFIPDFKHTENFWRLLHEDEYSPVHRRK